MIGRLDRMGNIDRMIHPDGYGWGGSDHWGWHDDHRTVDRTPAYKPALQQVRAEFAGLLDVLDSHDAFNGRALQLGLGETKASHEVWRSLFFQDAITIDRNCCALSSAYIGGFDTHDPEAFDLASMNAPYSFLFIDAGHTYADIKQDHEHYSPLVRPGGVVAFHDALRRHGFEGECEAWRYLADLSPLQRSRVSMIGSEVGIAWYVVE